MIETEAATYKETGPVYHGEIGGVFASRWPSGRVGMYKFGKRRHREADRPFTVVGAI